MKKNKKIGIILLAVIAGIVLILFLLGIYAKQKIKSTLDQELSNTLQYEEVDVSLINRRITFTNPEITFSGNTITSEEIALKGINFYQYLVNGNIRMDNVEIESPTATLGKAEDTSSQKNAKFKQDIHVNSVQIKNGKIRTVKNDTSATPLLVLLNRFNVSDVSINSETIQQKIPLNYGSYSFKIDSIRTALNPQHDISVGSIAAEDAKFNLERIRIIPKYDKEEFQEHIPYEKDRFELLVQNVQLDSLTWRFKNDVLEIRNTMMTLRQGDLEVYRNKLIRDDPRTKELYSQKVRALPFRIDLDSVRVESSKIVYEEKVKKSRPPGVVSFHEVNAGIDNVSNMGMDQKGFPQTVINANALFMGVTPLEVDWKFDISNEWESFTISGDFGTVPGSAINKFVRPAMNVEVNGNIDNLVFTYSGNNNKAVGDVRIKYRNFRVVVLEDDGTEKSSFWSTLANLFISNDAVNDEVVHEDLEVTRNKKKSFWNYVWLMIREGAIAAFL